MVVDDLKLSEPKTRLMAKALDSLVGSSSALVLLPEKSEAYEVVVRSTRNLPDAKTLLASYVNIRDLLGYDKIVLSLAALDVISANLA